MSNENVEKLNGEEQMQETGPMFGIQRIYTKGMSFETANTPHVFKMQPWQPDILLDINTATSKLEADTYEVMIRITATAKSEEKTIFVAEVEQAGIFSIKNMDSQRLHQMLGSFCPNILFPFAREAISDMVVRGSFPPIYLAPVNFDAVYEEQMKQKREKEQVSSASPAEEPKNENG